VAKATTTCASHETSLLVPPITVRPTESVDRVREGTSVIDTVNEPTPSPSISSPVPSTSSAVPLPPADTEPDVEPHDDAESTGSQRQLSTSERAAAIVRNQQLSLNPSLACFTVIGTSEPRLVKLFPNSSCTCPARDNCYHVFAARLAVGMTVDSGVKKRAINLTQLRKNAQTNRQDVWTQTPAS